MGEWLAVSGWNSLAVLVILAVASLERIRVFAFGSVRVSLLLRPRVSFPVVFVARNDSFSKEATTRKGEWWAVSGGTRSLFRVVVVVASLEMIRSFFVLSFR